MWWRAEDLKRSLHFGEGSRAQKPKWKQWPWTYLLPISAPSRKTCPAPISSLIISTSTRCSMTNSMNSDKNSNRDADTALGKRVLEETRWLLLKSPEKLDQNRGEANRLNEALELNQPLAIAYYLKEDLRQLCLQKTKKDTERFLDDWISQAEYSQVTLLCKFAKTLSEHRHGLLAYYVFPISNGPFEGTNNKIKTMKRQAYGFRDKEFFKLKIMTIHEKKYALVR